MTAQPKSLVIYQIAKGENIKVPIQRDSVWLTQVQMGQLFDKDVNTIGEHINNVYKEKELSSRATSRKFRVAQLEGKREIVRNLGHYNLDVIISVGYRVKSLRGTQFRIWATKVLRDHILQGYSVNKNRLIDTGIDELERAVNLISQAIFPPHYQLITVKYPYADQSYSKSPIFTKMYSGQLTRRDSSA